MNVHFHTMNYKALNITVVVLSIVLFSNCSKPVEEQVQSARPLEKIAQTDTVNLVGHWLNEGKRENFVKNLVRTYEFENQEIFINLKFPEETYYDPLDRTSNEKYNARVIQEGLTDWDILRINGEYQEVTEILEDPDWAKKHLVDFSKIEEFKDGTRPELLTEDTKERWNGMTPGPYLEGQYWAIWYNAEVAEKIGIDVKQFGMTFDDFSNYLRAVHRYNQNNPDDHIIPVYESHIWETTMLLALSLYSSLLDNPDEFHSARITQNRLNAWHETLKALEELAQYNPVDPSWTEIEWEETHDMMLDGECLFYVNGSWMYNIWEGIDEEKIYDIVPAELPAFGENITYPHAYTVTWGIPKNAPNREEAVDFLLDMNKPSVAEMWTRYTKCPTGIEGNLSSASFGGDQFENFSRYVQENYSENKYRYYWNSSWILNDEHANTPVYFREVFDGEMTADEAMEAIYSHIGY